MEKEEPDTHKFYSGQVLNESTPVKMQEQNSIYNLIDNKQHSI